jgi:hypothetical protein
MGAWGPAIFSDDLAADVREDFRDLIGDGLSAEDASERLKAEYADTLEDPDEGPVFLFALAATQWKTGHVVPAIVSEALAALHAGRGMERWEGAPPSDQKKRRRALDKLAQQLRMPPRDPLRISRRKQEDTPLRLGDVVGIARDHGRIFFAVVDFHVDKAGQAVVVKLLPFLDSLPADSSVVREAAESRTREELFETQPFFIAFNGGANPERLPLDVEVVAHGVLDSPPEPVGGVVTCWTRIADDAEPALRRLGLSDDCCLRVLPALVGITATP